ncbi:hypothetical protein IWQ62_000243 [Dispira parvispora]|uniref:Rad51-like C-terminal domain-containing protein n=1 Tax=Dispira parvispora TaxID=1520584 RepID=A0A9W8B0K7_9FUNG|nr:hypothetical protein IWQ62_000243 [Dispira parvispora]
MPPLHLTPAFRALPSDDQRHHLLDKLTAFDIRTDGPILQDLYDQILQRYACDPVLPLVQDQDSLITTGIPAIDQDLLRGGIPVGDVCEIVGTADSGQILLLHHLCAATLLRRHQSKVVYVDATARFSSHMLLGCLHTQHQLHTAGSLVSEDTYLERLSHVAVAEVHHLLQIITAFKTTSDADYDQDRVFVFDGLVGALLSPHFNGTSSGHANIITVGRALRALANIPHHTVICSNTTLPRPSTQRFKVNTQLDSVSCPQVKPLLGLEWTYVADTTLLLSAAADNTGDIPPSDSCSHPTVSYSHWQQCEVLKSDRTACHRVVRFRLPLSKTLS